MLNFGGVNLKSLGLQGKLLDIPKVSLETQFKGFTLQFKRIAPKTKG